MENRNNFLVRCRAIIIHEGKLLVVKHRFTDKHLALPGGHLDWGESIEECLVREIKEELGVVPKVERLLYVNNFTDGQAYSIEFFFNVANGFDFLNLEDKVRTHDYEIAEIAWLN